MANVSSPHSCILAVSPTLFGSEVYTLLEECPPCVVCYNTRLVVECSSRAAPPLRTQLATARSVALSCQSLYVTDMLQLLPHLKRR